MTAPATALHRVTRLRKSRRGSNGSERRSNRIHTTYQPPGPRSSSIVWVVDMLEKRLAPRQLLREGGQLQESRSFVKTAKSRLVSSSNDESISLVKEAQKSRERNTDIEAATHQTFGVIPRFQTGSFERVDHLLAGEQCQLKTFAVVLNSVRRAAQVVQQNNR